MPRLTWTIHLALIFSLMGCQPTEKPFTPTPKPAPVSTETATPPPTPTDLPTLTPRPQIAYVMAREQPVNCRFGPGTIYEVVDGLDAFQSAQISGKDYTGLWYYVHNPNNPGAFCWVASTAVDLEGNSEALTVLDPPYVTVNKLEVQVDPSRVTVKCDAFPQFVLLTAQITTNGPALVNWRWELSTGEATVEQPLVFVKAETQTVQLSYVIAGPNDYWAQLHVNAPNEFTTRANFIANCTP